MYLLEKFFKFMKVYKNISQLLNELCLDERISHGVFQIEDNKHMGILREKFRRMGIPANEAIELSNKMLEGKFPERQAYNSKGILVTFPNPEYKQRAIQRGTHFEEDPTKGAGNLTYDDNGGEPPVKQPDVAQAPAGDVVQVEPASNTQAPGQPAPVQPPPQQNTDDLQTRSPEDITQDAKEVEKVLTTEEAKKNGWKKGELNVWFDSKGNFAGHEWYCVDSHTKKIISIR